MLVPAFLAAIKILRCFSGVVRKGSFPEKGLSGSSPNSSQKEGSHNMILRKK